MKERHSIVCAAYLFLFDEQDNILLLRRFNTGYEDGNYSVPAGHVDEKESISNTLLREVEEEIGLNIDTQNTELVHVMHRHKGESNDERLDFFFKCRKWSGNIKNCEPHKCDDLRWFQIDSLPKNIIPYIRQGIQHADQNILYSEFGW